MTLLQEITEILEDEPCAVFAGKDGLFVERLSLVGKTTDKSDNMIRVLHSLDDVMMYQATNTPMGWVLIQDGEETGDCPFQTFEGAADTVYWYAYLNHKLGLVEAK